MWYWLAQWDGTAVVAVLGGSGFVVLLWSSQQQYMRCCCCSAEQLWFNSDQGRCQARLGCLVMLAVFAIMQRRI